MPKMKAVQISKPGGNFELVESNIPEPARNQVRIKVEACGICHSDAIVKEGHWPGLQYPRVPGHEIAGRIDAVGADVTNWKPGQRVGVGWHGGHCFVCDPCRARRFHQLPERKNHRHQPRWRLPGIHGHARRSRRRDPRRVAGRRSRAAALRGHHGLQRATQFGRAGGRSGRCARHRRTRPSRNPVRADRWASALLPLGAGRIKKRWRANLEPCTTSIPPPATRSRSCKSLAAHE